MSNIEQRILEEMIYDRVRATVNLCQLVIIEQELDENIQRAVNGMSPGADMDTDTDTGADTDAGRPQPAALAREHVQRAWQRLESEWQTLREDLAYAEAE
jgi:hypothetical protein